MTNSVANSKEKESSVRLVRSGRLPVEQLARVQIPYGAPRNLALQKEEFLERLKSISSNSTSKTDWKLEESRKHTVAPAYNKGAYQVIPKNEIKDIGR